MTVQDRIHAGVPAAGAVCAVVGVGLCWLLAHPGGPAASAWPGAVGLAAACLLLGLGGLEKLGGQARPATIAIVAGV
ncbi:MAG: copper resistance protein, partial [Gordonia sp. (in: high G+C Gram-positive bacteria)]